MGRLPVDLTTKRSGCGNKGTVSLRKIHGGSDMTPLAVNLRSPLLEGGFLSQIQSCFNRQEGENAENVLCNSLSLEEIAPCYNYLFELLPLCNEEQFRTLNTHLPHLLQRSPFFFTEQKKLSLALAKWQIDHSPPFSATLPASPCEAMHYFAKALQIAKKE